MWFPSQSFLLNWAVLLRQVFLASTGRDKKINTHPRIKQCLSGWRNRAPHWNLTNQYPKYQYIEAGGTFYKASHFGYPFLKCSFLVSRWSVAAFCDLTTNGRPDPDPQRNCSSGRLKMKYLGNIRGIWLMISLMSLLFLNSNLDKPSKVLLLFFVLGFFGVCTIAAWKLPSWSLAQEHHLQRVTGRNNKGDANDPGSLPLQFVFWDFASLFGRGPRFSDLPLSFLVPKLTVQTRITSLDFELGIKHQRIISVSKSLGYCQP